VKLTVDASMVVKWFVAEPMSDETRLLLAGRIHLQAPEFLLVEFANTIWKKERRGELSDARPYLVAGFDPRYAAGCGRHWRAGYKRVIGG